MPLTSQGNSDWRLMTMSEYDKWRAHVEAHKFTGPTIKLLHLENDLWAILDHEYNFLFTATDLEISWRIYEVQHPPQRERPKPKILEDYTAYPMPNPPKFNINTDDLDL